MQFQVRSGAMIYVAEVKGKRDVFEAIGKLREVLLPGPCGVCNGQNTFPASKTIKDDTFYEHVCGDCTATRRVVFMEDGRCFVSLKDKNKATLPNNGWSVYKPKGNGQASDFGSDGYAEPPSRQVNQPASHSDSDIPF